MVRREVVADGGPSTAQAAGSRLCVASEVSAAVQVLQKGREGPHRADVQHAVAVETLGDLGHQADGVPVRALEAADARQEVQGALVHDDDGRLHLRLPRSGCVGHLRHLHVPPAVPLDDFRKREVLGQVHDAITLRLVLPELECPLRGQAHGAHERGQLREPALVYELLPRLQPLVGVPWRSVLAHGGQQGGEVPVVPAPGPQACGPQ
mmetsp:Transcript_82217/g.266464  ORF Transcript_82217/g.266464 Transcript_82217/m.266464 type:complete len:208 (-) Transcript_82217:100-723(-)